MLRFCHFVVLMSLMSLSIPSNCVVVASIATPDTATDSAAATTVFANSLVQFEFDSTFTLVQIESLLPTAPYKHFSDSVADWWSVEIVTSTKPVTIAADSSCKSYESYYHNDTTFQSLRLTWNQVQVPLSSSTSVVNVTIDIILAHNASIAFFYFMLTPVALSSEPFGVWEVTYTFGALTFATENTPADDAVLIVPYGFGTRYQTPRQDPGTSGWSNMYPSGAAAYQFLCYYHTTINSPASQYAGLYVATHDATAATKTFAWEMSSSNKNESMISISMQPPNAGSMLTSSSVTFSFPVIAGTFSGDWWDASQIYRQWALQEAPWSKTQLANRPDVPQWFLDNTLWVNSGWQFLDIFNETQGDPAVVFDRLTTLYNYFNISSFALHWYEWDVIKFDTHYPDYFPAKDGFEEVVVKLQELGVNIAPYINGRIFDVNIPKWTTDHAIDFASKQCSAQVDSQDLSIYSESYGSGASFAAMCPYTSYWQAVIALTVQTLVDKYNVAGVYIDQIGAAAPRPCWDPTHDHVLGDGTSWSHGYWLLLDEARYDIGNGAVLVTESNAEPYMGKLNGYLTLEALSPDLAGTSAFIPVFPSVYGGYYVGFGATWQQSDFDNPDVAAAKLVRMMIHGTQLGWFSLGGTSTDPPMGLYDLLLNSAQKPFVQWMQLLCKYKTVLNPWLVYGREGRELDITTSNSMLPQSASAENVQATSSSPVDRMDLSNPIQWTLTSTLSAIWLKENMTHPGSSSVVILLGFPLTNSNVSFSFKITATEYLPVKPAAFQLFQLDENGNSKFLGIFGATISYSSNVEGRSFLAFLVQGLSEVAEHQHVAIY